MDGESLFCSNVNHMRFLSLYILRGGASYIFFCCLRRVLYSSVFCLSEYIGKGGNWKRKSSHFFLCIPTLLLSLQTFVCETECGPILAFCQASCSPSSPHSQLRVRWGQPGQQGTRLLGHSTLLSLELRRVVDRGRFRLWQNRCSANSAIAFSGDFLNCIIA